MNELQPEPPVASVPTEIDVKAVRSESIRAVRVILGRSKRAETDVPVPPALPRQGFEPRHRGHST